MRRASCWQCRVWWCWDKQRTTACCFRLPLLNDIFPRLSCFTVWQIKLFACLFQQNKTEMMTFILALASMCKCKRRSHAPVRRYFKPNYANKQPAIAGWHRDKGRDDWVLILWHEKTAIFLKRLLPSAVPLPNPVFFLSSLHLSVSTAN